MKIAACRFCGETIVQVGRQWQAVELLAEWVDHGIPADELDDPESDAWTCTARSGTRTTSHVPDPESESWIDVAEAGTDESGRCPSCGGEFRDGEIECPTCGWKAKPQTELM
jgi:hypothetical protein